MDTMERSDMVREYIYEQKTLQEIGELHEISWNVVRRILLEQGVTLRPPGRRPPDPTVGSIRHPVLRCACSEITNYSCPACGTPSCEDHTYMTVKGPRCKECTEARV